MSTAKTYSNMGKEKSVWEKIQDQFKKPAEPKPGPSPMNLDPDKVKAFVKAFR